MTRLLYEYALLQVVPRVDRGETMNAGVLVYCRAADFLGGRAHLDRARLAALDPHADADAIADLLETAVAVCAVPAPVRADRRTEGALGASGPGAGEDLGRRFRRLTAARSTVVRPGPVHTGLTSHPRDEPTRLFDRLVAPL